jgi:hypothetical protein
MSEGMRARGVASAASRIRTDGALRNRRPRCAESRDFVRGVIAVTDKINAIVDQAIAHTRALLESSQVEWETARVGLEKLRDSLAIEAAGHRALDRLRDFILEQDRVRCDH